MLEDGSPYFQPTILAQCSAVRLDNRDLQRFCLLSMFYIFLAIVRVCLILPKSLSQYCRHLASQVFLQLFVLCAEFFSL